MDLYDLITDHGAPPSPDLPDPHWRRDSRGFYFRLMLLKPDRAGLRGQGGVYVLWHRGVRPEWVHVGGSADIGHSLEAARDTEEVARFEVHGGLYYTWAPIAPDFRAGVVAYLRKVLGPVARPRLPGEATPDPDETPVAVLTPR